MKNTNTTARAKVLVTGAGGLSGSIVIREFIRQGIPVRALMRNREKARQWESAANVEIVEGDMLDTQRLGPVLEGIERVLLISSANQQMVETQCGFIDACKQAGVPHVIKFSGKESQIGYDPQQFRYTREHEEIEAYLESAGLLWTHLQPSQFMQVYLREATIASRGELLLPLEEIEMSPVDLDDVAKVAVALLDRGGHTSERLSMTGPQALSMAAIAAIIGKVLGKPVRYVPITFEQRRQAHLAAGLPAYLADAIMDQSKERCRHPKAHIDLGTHGLFDVQPTTFEAFAYKNFVKIKN
jgi:uncharacterized protein YbjT (DUF2867 family)